MNQVFTEKAPPTVGPYSQAIVSGGLVFASGQLGLNDRGALAEGIAGQTEQAIRNLSAVLSAAGSDLSLAVKTTCFLSDIGDFSVFNEVYGKYFPQKPARSLIQAAALPKGALVEIEAIAEIKKED